MKEWWINLSLREKQTVALGSVLVFIFLIYELIFASLSSSVEHLRQQIHKNKSLLTWMQESDKRIQQLEKNQHSTNKSSASLISIVQDDLNNNPISKKVTELRFQQVSFDDMTAWLINLSRDQQLIITQMTVTPVGTAGIVDAVLRLQTG